MIRVGGMFMLYLYDSSRLDQVIAATVSCLACGGSGTVYDGNGGWETCDYCGGAGEIDDWT